MLVPFNISNESTQNISVSASSQSVLLSSEQGPFSVRIMNNGTATVWVSFGDYNVAASLATSVPIPSGGVEVLSGANYKSGGLYVAVIAAAATGSIYFTTGRGI